MAKFPSPRTIVSLGRTPGGTPLFASRYTRYHWDRTVRAFEKQFPGAKVYILQGSYHIGFKPSAGTHDRDAVLDVWVTGVDWREAEFFFRQQGWKGWWRHTGSWSAPSQWHIHMISPGTPNAVGDLIPSQLAAYDAGRLGLARSVDGPDTVRRPSKVDHFDYQSWCRQLEEERMNNVQKAREHFDAAFASARHGFAYLKLAAKGRPRVRTAYAAMFTAHSAGWAAYKKLPKS